MTDSHLGGGPNFIINPLHHTNRLGSSSHINDGSRCGDCNAWPEIYVCSNEWEALQISSPLVFPTRWRVTNPRASYHYIGKSQRVTLRKLLPK